MIRAALMYQPVRIVMAEANNLSNQDLENKKD
jgi:hypothetical protein